MKIPKSVHTKSGRIDKRRNVGGKLLMAAAKKAAKKAASERQKRERQAVSARKAYAREQEKRMRAKEREAARLEREAEKQRQKDLAALEKKNKKISQYVNRFQLECEKIGLFFDKEIALEVAEKCIQSSVTPAQLKKYFIDGNESEFLERAIRSRMLSVINSRSDGMNPASYYLRSKTGKMLLASLVEAKVKNNEELRKFPSLKSFLNGVEEEETETKHWQNQAKKVSDQLKKIIETRSMLPDDIDEVVKFVESSKQLTLEVLKSSEVYKKGRDKKTKFSSDIEQRYSALISD